jgi:hypothetical protein
MRNPAALGRPDSNHSDVVKAYEDAYCTVLDLSKVGFGCPDILIALGQRCYLREIKTEHGHLGPAQKRFMDVWRGPKIEVMRTQADVLNDILNLRQHISRGRY